jgi:hypothetical protein
MARIRSFTRVLKNARYLQAVAPQLFRRDPKAKGFGTGLPTEVLRNLHRIPHHSPLLKPHPDLSNLLKRQKFPAPRRVSRDALFSGTIHFALVTFNTSGGPIVIPTADMDLIVQYAQHAIAPISKYAAAQYGPNSVSISSEVLSYSVEVPDGQFTDADLQGWINDMAAQNGLAADSCIFVICPQGIFAADVGGDGGYHNLANIPYIVGGVFATNLTLRDEADVFAMLVSHEIAELVVDPKVDGNNPEVCDPCDLNCNNLTRIYFDASDALLGFNQATPPGGFDYQYYICAVVKAEGAADCPAKAADCQYAPDAGIAKAHAEEAMAKSKTRPTRYPAETGSSGTRVPKTMEALRKVGPRPNVVQIVPPRHVYRPAYLRAQEKEDHELVTNPLSSPTGPGGAAGFRNRAGSQIATPHVTNVYLGDFWGDRDLFEGFSKAVVENGYLDPLRSLGYGTGSGSYLGAVKGDPVAPGTLNDSDVRVLIARMLDAGTLHADANTLFMLILPDGVVSRFDGDGSESCSAFCGYHDAFTHQGIDVAYAIMPSPTDCQGCGAGEMGDFTAVYAHELAEACSDKVPGKGWMADDGEENGDLEAWILFGWGPPEDPHRYTVQGYYTNQQGNTVGVWRSI